MDLPCWRYYKLNRIFLLPFGLWPHGNRKLKPIQATFFSGILASSVVPQLMKIFTADFNLDFILPILSCVMSFMISAIRFSTFYIRAERIRRLMRQIQDDWNSLKNEREILIIRKYTVITRHYTVVCALSFCLMLTCFISYLYTQHFLDFVSALNESRPRRQPFLAEYFVDQEIYFDIILAHMIVGTVAAAFAFLGTETIFIAYVHHACGMLKIASYRLKHVLDGNIIRNSTVERNICIRERIIDAIQVHRKAIHFFITRQIHNEFFPHPRFFDYYSETVRLSDFVTLSIGIASFTINLFQVAILSINAEGIILLLSLVLGQFCCMFLYCYVGQKLTDHNADVFKKTYNMSWYEVSVQSQKLLLFMMQRSTQDCKILLGGIFSVSLEGVTTLTSMSLSYFTVLCSTR